LSSSNPTGRLVPSRKVASPLAVRLVPMPEMVDVLEEVMSKDVKAWPRAEALCSAVVNSAWLVPSRSNGHRC
jgi:hypothetical protein